MQRKLCKGSVYERGIIGSRGFSIYVDALVIDAFGPPPQSEG